MQRKRKSTTKSDAKSDFHSSGIAGVAFPAVYASILSVLCLAYGVIPRPELIVLCFFLYAAYNKRSRSFVKDWTPFVSSFLSYEALGVIIGPLSGTVHVEEPKIAEMQLFGAIPTRTPTVLPNSFFGLSGSFFLFSAFHSSDGFCILPVEVSSQKLSRVHSGSCDRHLQCVDDISPISNCASLVWSRCHPNPNSA